jgi:RNA recognition motif. (a.k.a. RRM, RBD, or RNP domain)
VKADINEDRATGRSRGFGTVLFETGEQAAAAIEVCEEGSERGPFRSQRIAWRNPLSLAFAGHRGAGGCDILPSS